MARKQPAAKPASQTGLVNQPTVEVKPAAKGGAKLDRSKPFGEIWGESGAKFEQNGKLYDAQENECDIDGKPVKAKVEKAEPPAAPAAETTGEGTETGNVTSEDELAALSGGN